ncbi:hypothetical protein GCM10023165_55720 [Variovorax defluvii]|uniref:Type II secretion system protein H n=2 Tax=Variovorax defluvii TaxID=913761 RepID=A0ABP8IIP6_9BURK
MVVITMVAILMALAAPSFSALVKNTRVWSFGNEFVAGVGYARAEAITRNKCVTMCVPKNINASTLECAPSGNEWNSGWIIFSNPKCDNVPGDTTAELLKAYVGDPAGPSLKGTGTPISLRFDSSGRLSLGTPSSLSISPPGEAATKMVCIDMMGRTRIGNVGSISCDGSNQN